MSRLRKPGLHSPGSGIASTGQPIGEPLTGHSERVQAVAIGRTSDGDTIIVSGSLDHTIRIKTIDAAEAIVLDMLQPVVSRAVLSPVGHLYVGGSNVICAFSKRIPAGATSGEHGWPDEG